MLETEDLLFDKSESEKSPGKGVGSFLLIRHFDVFLFVRFAVV